MVILLAGNPVAPALKFGNVRGIVKRRRFTDKAFHPTTIA